MADVQLSGGPLDGLGINLGDDPPERVALDLPPRCGGPGIVFYNLDRDERGRPVYRFAGWKDGRTGNGHPG